MIRPVVVVSAQTKKMHEEDEKMMDEKYYELLLLAREVGFEVGSLKPYTPHAVAAKRILVQYSAENAREFGLPGDDKIIETFSQILGTIRSRPPISMPVKIYTEDSNLRVCERMGPMLWAPIKVPLVRPSPTEGGQPLGITGAYAAISTFNALFTSSFYEEDGDNDGHEYPPSDEDDVEEGPQPDLSVQGMEDDRQEDIVCDEADSVPEQELDLSMIARGEREVDLEDIEQVQESAEVRIYSIQCEN